MVDHNYDRKPWILNLVTKDKTMNEATSSSSSSNIDYYPNDLNQYSTSMTGNLNLRPQYSSAATTYQQQQNEFYNNSPGTTAYFGGLSMMDDLESYTRERSHTWHGLPMVSVRDLDEASGQNSMATMTGGGLMTDEDGDSQQLQYSLGPPPLTYHPPAMNGTMVTVRGGNSSTSPANHPPSRGSSGLSLISEGNESLLNPSSTPMNFTTTSDSISPLPPTITPTATPATTASGGGGGGGGGKRSNAGASSSGTPSYKSGHPSYVELITQAINSSMEKRMTLAEIYDWMVTNVPSFKDQRHLHSSAGWKNSVRHNLSLHARFKRVKRNGMDKPSWWTVDLTEETKRERAKRPRQSRPRANTTTATSREMQTQRQRPPPGSTGGNASTTSRASIGFAQPSPQTILRNHHEHHISGGGSSSGRGSLSFSGSLTPASSIGSDIFTTGVVANSYGLMSTTEPGGFMSLPPPLLPPSLAQPLTSIGTFGMLMGDGIKMEDCMDWANPSAFRLGVDQSDHSMADGGGGLSSILETPSSSISTDLHSCLSQAITASLNDHHQAPSNGLGGLASADIKREMESGNCGEGGGNHFYGQSTSSSGNVVTNLAQQFRQNTLVDDGKTTISKQLLRVQMSAPQTRAASSSSCDYMVQQPGSLHPGFMGGAGGGGGGGGSPMPSLLQYSTMAAGVATGSNNGGIPLSAQSQQFRQTTTTSSPSSYIQNGGTRKGLHGSLPGQQLPDDLAALDVGGFDCNIMDVLSYEMNCNTTDQNRIDASNTATSGY